MSAKELWLHGLAVQKCAYQLESVDALDSKATYIVATTAGIFALCCTAMLAKHLLAGFPGAVLSIWALMNGLKAWEVKEWSLGPAVDWLQWQCLYGEGEKEIATESIGELVKTFGKNEVLRDGKAAALGKSAYFLKRAIIFSAVATALEVVLALWVFPS